MTLPSFHEWLRSLGKTPKAIEPPAADQVQQVITAAGPGGISLARLRATISLPYQLVHQIVDQLCQTGLVVMNPSSSADDPILRSRV